jgi:ribosomal protein S18 acetylase RimI-like enzyme
MDSIIKLDYKNSSSVPSMYARAFFHDPLLKFLIPDGPTRQKRLVSLFDALLRYGLSGDEVYASSHVAEAAAVWVSPDMPRISSLGTLLGWALPLPFKVGLGTIRRLLRFDKYASAVHNRCISGPHWYLFCLASDPDHRGKGHAGALVESMNSRLDDEALPCYLETNNESNVSYYTRFGFALTEQGLIPGTNVGHWGMVRLP